MKLTTIAILSTLIGSSYAQVPKTLDALLNQVRKERVEKKKELNERERRFVNEKNKQQKLLLDAQKECHTTASPRSGCAFASRSIRDERASVRESR